MSRYKSLGPLLDDGDKPVPNPIAVKASPWDFSGFLMGLSRPGVFAPFNRLTYVLWVSKGELKNKVYGASVAFGLAGKSLPIHMLTKLGLVFELTGFKARELHHAARGTLDR
ncbi:MAG: hypothetical protein EXR77_09755 [Myxococcales bacterium]|nr:hypothetical protein [Myxococcales bacterium]